MPEPQTNAEDLRPTERFTDRVEAYRLWRPTYPAALFDALRERHGMAAPGPRARAIADLGAGTGIASRELLERGYEVFGVEPNAAMRVAAEQSLEPWLRRGVFHLVAGSAEATGLPAHSVAAVTAFQAWHWFRADEARREAERIVRPGGLVALVWNRRRVDTPFLRDYEALLHEFAGDYPRINHAAIPPERIRAFFGGAGPARECFEYHQWFDFEGLKGRLLSSSYAPGEGHPAHAPMLARLGEIFARHAQTGADGAAGGGAVIDFAYDTELYAGRLA